ncbi:hypothetical protein ASG29_07260 [Sphingomonas sp. Leaf412]|uniref:endonuclease domain-containing protein n=1 Tax=Sphingomonas sp. Leaf412 TaxID=1736370 RepID=UPI0006F7E29B|nr:endonuclease domain-containing protein [Sphingomonas sp. Leaf412]KQT31719.1 hypothetical protein ASG29_07260 [Sphingomonas sp. Leaf412]
MQTVTRARRLRSDMTLPEVLLWRALRTRPAGLKFRRQHPAGDFILDFYCAAANLAVEVDGQIHASADQIEHDRRRGSWLARRDVRVLRLPASLILSDMAAALEAILASATPGQPLHQPSAGPPPHAGEDLRTS